MQQHPLWDTVSFDQMKALLKAIGNDGHTIWPVDYLIKNGVDAELVMPFAENHVSDGSVKGSIERNGQIVDSMRGVYGLKVLWSLASYFYISSDKMGRGFQARDLTEKLNKVLNDENA